MKKHNSGDFAGAADEFLGGSIPGALWKLVFLNTVAMLSRALYLAGLPSVP
jgi:hypothetical protein